MVNKPMERGGGQIVIAARQNGASRYQVDARPGGVVDSTCSLAITYRYPSNRVLHYLVNGWFGMR